MSPDSDGFLELALLSWNASASRTHGSPEQDAQKQIHLLAELLRAASLGTGAVRLPKSGTAFPSAETIDAHPEFFARQDDLVLLPRYAAYATEIRAFFAKKLSEKSQGFEDESVRAALDAILPSQQTSHPSTGEIVFDNVQQRLAIAALVDANVGIITGGPGTGKTTTAAGLLAVRKRLSPGFTADEVLIAAPTGKAACRIAEAIARATHHLQGLSDEETGFLRSIRSLTLHKALEWSLLPAEKGGPFQRGPNRTLDASLVIVDEASMIDTGLMHALIRALPAHASLLLLGDSDQLESVEVGGVLSDLMLRSRHSALPQNRLAQITRRLGMHAADISQLADTGPSSFQADFQSVEFSGLAFGLKYSHRAMHAPWIIQLAAHVRPGTQTSMNSLVSLLESHPTTALEWVHDKPSRECLQHCRTQWKSWQEASRAWQAFNSETDPDKLAAALDQLHAFQLLCSTNAQVERANKEGTALLWGAETAVPSALPHGCPILVNANSYTLGLSNGDVGIAIGARPHAPATLALFDSSEGRPRLIPLPQLPEHGPAFALTIHKSQGSEWRHVAIELPAKTGSSVLSKNLLYTAITRSSGRLSLFGSHAVLKQVLES